MRIPRDWDKPTEGNKELCDKFSYGEYLSYGKLIYRLFTPTTDDKVPLVVYLHGADAFGNDNEEHLFMHDIGTTFAKDEWQAHDPCFILAPQCKAGSYWSMRSSGGLVYELIEKMIIEDNRIDSSRIYIYGYSAGAIGTIRILKEKPDFFAAAVSICGATERDKLEILKSIPLWLIHADDDEIVRCSYRDDTVGDTLLGSADIYEILGDTAEDMHFTEYPEGFMKEKYGVNPHCTWVPAAEDMEVKRWMFSHSLYGSRDRKFTK